MEADASVLWIFSVTHMFLFKRPLYILNFLISSVLKILQQNCSQAVYPFRIRTYFLRNANIRTNENFQLTEQYESRNRFGILNLTLYQKQFSHMVEREVLNLLDFYPVFFIWLRQKSFQGLCSNLRFIFLLCVHRFCPFFQF